KPGFNGEKLSLNFQNIEVRSVLQVIADFTGLNVVTSDTVNGSITLRLKDVPWDQAMDIIMQSKGLSQRKIGNIIWVAPSDELAAKEKQQLEAQQQVEDLEPLYTEVFTLKYQKANDLKAILTDSKQKILSKRGSAVVDPRTNTLFVQDTAKYIAGVQRIINKIDIAVRQVLIESRIVIADTGFSKELGVRFGIVQNPYLVCGQPGNGWNSMISGSTRSNYNTAQTGTTTTPTDLNVNLPATSPTAGSFAFSIFKLPAGILLNLELSAAEADSKSKLISSPRVITMNQQKATIEQGVEIPYQQASSSGATNVSFKKATLSLAVTPQITPDDKISMDLDVHKDSVGQIYNGVPSINTRQVTTQVQVDNGETAVLGGIYEEAKSESVDKVPFFGDLPVLGHLFKRNSQTAQKNELLIFITPKLMQDSVL
ncbi:MAG TPA: type IV pilus secretin PilQ family protein, partial [Methylophilaceae bacterium]|nr:type IV pilus secretin PilQ family protein [Methylophilaceae bacterium]